MTIENNLVIPKKKSVRLLLFAEHLKLTNLLFLVLLSLMVSCDDGGDGDASCDPLSAQTCQLVKSSGDSFSEGDADYLYESGRLNSYYTSEIDNFRIEYDNNGRIFSVSHFVTPQQEPIDIAYYSYDDSRIIEIRNADNTTTFVYNEYGQLKKQLVDGQVIKTFEYPNNCTLNYSKSMSTYNSLNITSTTTYKYDKKQNPEFGLKLSPIQTPNNVIEYVVKTPSSTGKYKLEYNYNQDGYPTTVSTIVNGTPQNTKNFTYINCLH